MMKGHLHRNVIGLLTMGLLTAAATIMMTACSGSGNGEVKAQETSGAGGTDIQAAFIVDRLGDNAANDESYRGIQEFEAKTGIKVTTVEAPELQDHEINARTFAQEGYGLIIDATSFTSEIYEVLAPEFPDSHFVIVDGTVDGQDNVTSLRCRPEEAAFLTGAFNVLMNQELGGGNKAAFIGGMRNPDLERSQYGFTAGAEYVGGEATVVYVGNFTDVAKGKEIALQLYNNGMKLVQAFAGGAGMGVYQAAESVGEGVYAIGGAAGQFNLSDSIVASQVKLTGNPIYDVCMEFYEGGLEGGIQQFGLKEGAVGIKYNPLHEEKVPGDIKTRLEEIQGKIVSGEIVPPSNEESFNSFGK
ncbi:BMP family ABC transporter substrate-binding protein [Enterocloster aldenensis]|nr:BMP family ABC transporter substrate-binding protein [Enterocloster aldenensis]